MLFAVALSGVIAQSVAQDPFGLIGRRYTDTSGTRNLIVTSAVEDDNIGYGDPNLAQYKVDFFDSTYRKTNFRLCTLYKKEKELSCDELLTLDEIAQHREEQKKLEQERAAAATKRKKKAALAAQQAALDEKKRFQEMERKGWPKEIIESIRSKSVRIGMTMEQARESWGAPDDVSRAMTATGTTEQWRYGYKSFLYFSDGLLTMVQN